MLAFDETGLDRVEFMLAPNAGEALKPLARIASGGEMATFFGIPASDFVLISGKPKPFHYVAESGKGLDRNFCPDCGSRLFTTNLDSFPGTVFIMLGSLDQPGFTAPKLEMFTKRRLQWMKPLDLPQFPSMPG